MTPDDTELTHCLESCGELLEGVGQLVILGDRLAARATTGPTLTPQEAQDARAELDAAREAVERVDTLLTLRRQSLREM